MKILFAISLCLLLSGGLSELFTAVTHMEGLVSMEKDLLYGLNSYITAEKERLKKLERFAKTVDHALELFADKDFSSYLYDPVNAFQLVNRYNNGWLKLHEQVFSDNSQDLMANISMNRYQFPANEDVDGAIAALLRLQETYNLDSNTVAKGSLGSSKGLSMSSEDCYIVGRYAYNQKLWRHSRQWMLAALEKFDQEGGSGLDIPAVYDHLSFSEYSLGNIKKASRYTRDLLQHDPYHERAQANEKYFRSIAADEPDRFVDGEEEDAIDPAHAKYEQLCREPQPIPSHLHKKFICYYYNNNRNPRLVFAPIKTEVAFLEPKIYIFHDLISDREIERLKELASPKLNRATATNSVTGIDEPLNRATVHGNNGELVHATYRISKSGWLQSSDDPLGYVDRIDQRIGDVTGLDMSTAEQLQVVNYGIGGHYEPHYDFARTGEDAFSSLGSGNRIATLLIYLSDVEIGGATVFPLVGARISPIKGSASYWWNLKKSGKGDYDTRHAGCPVLVGSKWVCNKWIHERGQEFRRPCGLSPEE